MNIAEVVVGDNNGVSVASLEQQGPDKLFDEDCAVRLLLVEDSRADVLLVREALSMHLPEAQLDVAEDGEIALHEIEKSDPDGRPNCPDLLLLDLNLPKRTGDEVLERFRQRCHRAPVIIITSSDAQRDRERTARLGANFYFRKPSNYDDYMKLGEVARDLIVRH